MSEKNGERELCTGTRQWCSESKSCIKKHKYKIEIGCLEALHTLHAPTARVPSPDTSSYILSWAILQSSAPPVEWRQMYQHIPDKSCEPLTFLCGHALMESLKISSLSKI